MITKRDDILSAIKAYMSHINLQHGTTTVENRKTTKVKRLQSKNGYAQKGERIRNSMKSVL